MTTVSSLFNKRDRPVKETLVNREDITLIWLDENINDSADSQNTQCLLRDLNSYVQFYTDHTLCRDYIKSVKDEKVFLIVSDVLASFILYEVQQLPSVSSVFILCNDRVAHIPLREQYSKIVAVVADRIALLESVQSSLQNASRQVLGFSLFSQTEKSTKNLSTNSGSFLCFQLLLNVLRQMPHDATAKSQMVDFCQEYYQSQGNESEVSKIKMFEETYRSDKAIEWYTADSFLYRLLNKALRTEDVELLHLFRFYIIDLCERLAEEHKQLNQSTILTLFRGTCLASEELKKLQEHVGSLISTNGFFSTSQDVNTALIFAGSDTDKLKSVLFEISADPQLKAVVFADVDKYSRMRGEKEVLFSLGAVFRIDSVDYDNDRRLWKVKMTATDEGSKTVEEYLELYNNDMADGQRNPITEFGAMLWNHMRQIQKAEKYFKLLLRTLPEDHQDLDGVYHNIGNVYWQKDEMNLALKYFEHAYEMRKRRFPGNHPRTATSLNNIGLAYYVKGDFDRALHYYNQSMAMKEKVYPGNHIEKANTLTNMGLAYGEKKDFSNALDYYTRSYEMRKQLLPKEHALLADSLWKIGGMYVDQEDYQRALEYFHEAYEMEEKVYSNDHPKLNDNLSYLADAYKKKRDIEDGLAFFLKQLKLQKSLLGEAHSRVAHTLMIIGGLVEEPNEKLNYYQQALNVLDECNPSDYTIKIKCLANKSALFSSLEAHQDALELRSQILALQNQILPSDHNDIALSLKWMGSIHFDMKNYSIALDYFEKTMKIYKINLSVDHDTIKEVQRRIDEVKRAMSPALETELIS